MEEIPPETARLSAKPYDPVESRVDARKAQVARCKVGADLRRVTRCCSKAAKGMAMERAVRFWHETEIYRGLEMVVMCGCRTVVTMNTWNDTRMAATEDKVGVRPSDVSWLVKAAKQPMIILVN